MLFSPLDCVDISQRMIESTLISSCWILLTTLGTLDSGPENFF